jgi:hypothetical protein
MPEPGALYGIQAMGQIRQVLPRSTAPDESETAPEGAAFRGIASGPGRMPIALAIAAIALVGVAVVSRGLSEPSTPRIQEVTPPPRVATANPEPAATGFAAPTLPALAVGNPAVPPRATIPPTPVEAGTAVLVPAGQSAVRLIVTLPEGWTRVNPSVLARTDEASGAPIVSITAWSLMHVNVFPCRWSAEIFADEDLMRTTRGQAEALGSWWGQDPGMPANSNAAIAPLATEPFQTTLSGYPARYLEVLIPRGLDFARCDGGQIVLWHTSTGEAKRSLGPGELSRLWVVDVAGEPIVVDVSTMPEGTAYAEELAAIVGTTVIER